MILILYFLDLMTVFQYSVFNVNVIAVVYKYFSASAILVISCAGCLMLYIECDVFHFHGTYLNGIYGNKINK